MTTITPKFQIYIPVKIRKQAGITKRGKARTRVEKSRIIIETIHGKEGILALAGSIKIKKPISVEKIRDYIDYSDI